MADTPTLVRFFTGWEDAGQGSDGMPIFAENIMVRLDRPPFLSVVRVAEPDDFHDHRLAFEMYQKEQSARKQSYVERYYAMKVDHPRYVGGYFRWYFAEDMVPRSQPLFGVLSDAIAKAQP